METQFAPLGPRSMAIKFYFFPNNHNRRIKNVTLGNGVKWEVQSLKP